MRLLTALTVLWALMAALAAAEPLDRLFSTSGITQLPEGSALIYRHRRADGRPAGGEQATERTIRIERQAGKANVIASLEGGAAPRQLATFRGTTGNPVALLFIDSVVARVSEASGANPFYLRNRIKEAMQERRHVRQASVRHGGSDLPAQEVTLRPFETDEHADELGIFAALELAFLLSDAVPGGFVSLRATAGEGTGGYMEEILLDGTK